MLGCFYNTNFRLGKSKIRLTKIPQYKYSGKKRFLPDEFVWTSSDKKRKLAYFVGVLGNKSGKYASFSTDSAVFHTVLRFPEIHPDAIYRHETHEFFADIIQRRIIPICGNVLIRSEVGVSGTVHVHVVSVLPIPIEVDPHITYTNSHNDLARLLVYLSKPVDARYDTKHPMRLASLHALAVRRGAPHQAVVGIRAITASTRVKRLHAQLVGNFGRYWFLMFGKLQNAKKS